MFRARLHVQGYHSPETLRSPRRVKLIENPCGSGFINDNDLRWHTERRGFFGRILYHPQRWKVTGVTLEDDGKASAEGPLGGAPYTVKSGDTFLIERGNLRLDVHL